MKRKEIFEKLRNIIVENLGAEKEKITEESNFVDDLAADSLDIVEIVMEIEDEFDIQVSDEDAEEIATVKDVIDFIETKKG